MSAKELSYSTDVTSATNAGKIPWQNGKGVPSPQTERTKQKKDKDVTEKYQHISKELPFIELSSIRRGQKGIRAGRLRQRLT